MLFIFCGKNRTLNARASSLVNSFRATIKTILILKTTFLLTTPRSFLSSLPSSQFL